MMHDIKDAIEKLKSEGAKIVPRKRTLKEIFDDIVQQCESNYHYHGVSKEVHPVFGMIEFYRVGHNASHLFWTAWIPIANKICFRTYDCMFGKAPKYYIMDKPPSYMGHW